MPDVLEQSRDIDKLMLLCQKPYVLSNYLKDLWDLRVKCMITPNIGVGADYVPYTVINIFQTNKTICDAGPSLGEKILYSKSQVYPILG